MIKMTTIVYDSLNKTLAADSRIYNHVDNTWTDDNDKIWMVNYEIYHEGSYVNWFTGTGDVEALEQIYTRINKGDYVEIIGAISGFSVTTNAEHTGYFLTEDGALFGIEPDYNTKLYRCFQIVPKERYAVFGSTSGLYSLIKFLNLDQCLHAGEVAFILSLFDDYSGGHIDSVSCHMSRIVKTTSLTLNTLVTVSQTFSALLCQDHKTLQVCPTVTTKTESKQND